MKKQRILEKSIEDLGVEAKILKILKENNIIKIEDLWKMKRKELRDLKLCDSEITKIAIKLQLYGLDLNKKIY